MSTLRLRPRVCLRVDLSAEQVRKRFAAQLELERPVSMSVFEGQVELRMQPDRAHFWSPFLNLIIRDSDGECVMEGKFGPNVNVWTMFLAGYAMLSISGGFAAMLGMSQWSLQQTPTGLYIAAGCATAIVIEYVVGIMGQRLAHPQMFIIHDYLAKLFEDVLLEMKDEDSD